MRASRIFLLICGILYVALGIWCSVLPRATAENIGYGLPDSSALSEYLVVYGGLEIGLGLFLLMSAWRLSAIRTAIWMTFLLHACLALYRLLTIIALEGLSSTIYGLFVVEGTLAIVAGVLASRLGLPE